MRHSETRVFLGKKSRDFQYGLVQAQWVIALVLERIEVSVHVLQYQYRFPLDFTCVIQNCMYFWKNCEVIPLLSSLSAMTQCPFSREKESENPFPKHRRCRKLQCRHYTPFQHLEWTNVTRSILWLPREKVICWDDSSTRVGKRAMWRSKQMNVSLHEGSGPGTRRG